MKLKHEAATVVKRIADLLGDSYETHEQAMMMLAYGDCWDLGCRMLQFQSEPSENFDRFAELLRTVEGYNAYDPERVVNELLEVKDLARWQFGRESSPVIYAQVKAFKLDRAEVFRACKSIALAGEYCAADEISFCSWSGEHQWFEHSDEDFATDGHAMRGTVRLWWD